jgi:hypothetical protein
MKKMISIVLTTGLLLSTVAFSALADPRRNPDDEFKGKRQIKTVERRHPHVKKRIIIIKRAPARPQPKMKHRQKAHPLPKPVEKRPYRDNRFRR